jgi:hypothetical protein
MRPVTTVLVVLVLAVGPGTAQTFDHRYAAYGDLLARHVNGTRVDYRGLSSDRAALEGALAAFAGVSTDVERGWTPPERLAFWINAYNLFTLDAIVDHYPIRARLFTLQPRNSIRQIDGVWTKLSWAIAGRQLTLDGIEHGIIRKEFREPLIHFAVNCASISCPPLRPEPYVASKLSHQLEESARRYLASLEGARIEGSTLRVSSIFKWYGGDFVKTNAPESSVDRAILDVLRTYGPPDVARRAADPATRLSYLSYNWTLNDVEPSS